MERKNVKSFAAMLATLRVTITKDSLEQQEIKKRDLIASSHIYIEKVKGGYIRRQIMHFEFIVVRVVDLA